MYTDTVSISTAASFCKEANAKREWLVTKGKGRLGTSQISRRQMFPPIPKRHWVRSSKGKSELVCVQPPPPLKQNQGDRPLSPQFCSRRRGGRLKANAEPVILKMKQAFFESYCEKINNALHTIRNTLIRLYGIDQ